MIMTDCHANYSQAPMLSYSVVSKACQFVRLVMYLKLVMYSQIVNLSLVAFFALYSDL